MQFSNADIALQSAVVPNKMKPLRACIACLMVKTYAQFYDRGCENCTFFNLQEDHDLIMVATTDKFQGLAAIINGEQSWVARWLRVAKLVPGTYAIKVNAALPMELEELLEKHQAPNLGKLSQQDS